MSTLPLGLEVIQNDLVKGGFVASRSLALSFSAVDGGVIDVRHRDGAGEPIDAAGFNGLHDRSVLTFHEGRDRAFINFLGDQVVVGRPSGVENLTGRVNEAFDKGVRLPFILGLNVIDGVGILDVCVVTR